MIVQLVISVMLPKHVSTVLQPLLSSCWLLGKSLCGPQCIRWWCNYTVWPPKMKKSETGAPAGALSSSLQVAELLHPLLGHTGGYSDSPSPLRPGGIITEFITGGTARPSCFWLLSSGFICTAIYLDILDITPELLYSLFVRLVLNLNHVEIWQKNLFNYTRFKWPYLELILLVASPFKGK